MPAAATWAGNPALGTTIAGWKFLGCQSEINGRLLRGASYTSTNAMTIEACQTYCAKANFGLAGVEYGQECYCGNVLSRGNTLSNPPQCTMACKGSAQQKCGGGNAISVFNNTAYVPPGPSKVAGWTYSSCYMEPQTGRALPDKLWSDPAMTVSKCTTYCANAGYPWAGLEYGTECWCGKNLTPGLQDASDPGCAMQCNMVCGGASSEVCGGAGAVTIYKKGSAPAASKAGGMRRREPKADTVKDGVFTRSGRFVKVRRET